MTREDVISRLEDIHKIADDDEVAHAKEDKLHQAVLRAISDGDCDDPMLIRLTPTGARC